MINCCVFVRLKIAGILEAIAIEWGILCQCSLSLRLLYFVLSTSVFVDLPNIL